MKLPFIPFQNHTFDVIVLANGDYPHHFLSKYILQNSPRIVCCDGAANRLLESGMKPWAIVGDLDSLQAEQRTWFAGKIIQIPDQTTNDLTKAIEFCCREQLTNICILGATGMREDHTLANISLLVDYALRGVQVQMYTNTGVFTPVLHSSELESFKGQQISIFSLTPDTVITSSGLRYPLHELKLTSWWVGSLNEALGNLFTLHFENGQLLIYRKYADN